MMMAGQLSGRTFGVLGEMPCSISNIRILSRQMQPIVLIQKSQVTEFGETRSLYWLSCFEFQVQISVESTNALFKTLSPGPWVFLVKPRVNLGLSNLLLFFIGSNQLYHIARHVLYLLRENVLITPLLNSVVKRWQKFTEYQVKFQHLCLCGATYFSCLNRCVWEGRGLNKEYLNVLSSPC